MINYILFADDVPVQALPGISPILKLIVIIGVFQGMKELPPMVEKVLGIKLGDGQKKTFGQVVSSLVGGTIGAAVGLGIGGIAGAAGAGKGHRLSGLLAGAGKGAFTGINNGNKGGVLGAAKGTGAMIKNTNQLGGNIGHAGGLGHYVVGGVENFFGANNNNEKTLKMLDDSKTEIDKLYNSDKLDAKGLPEGKIARLNKTHELSTKAAREIHENRSKSDSKLLEGYQRSISDYQGASQLRSSISSSLASSYAAAYGSFDDFVDNDAVYRDLVATYEARMKASKLEPTDEKYREFSAGEQQYLLDEISDKKRQLRESYKQKQNAYYDEQLSFVNLRSNGASVADAIDSMVEEDYVLQTLIALQKDHADKGLTTYAAGDQKAIDDRRAARRAELSYLQNETREREALKNALDEYHTYMKKHFNDDGDISSFVSIEELDKSSAATVRSLQEDSRIVSERMADDNRVYQLATENREKAYQEALKKLNEEFKEKTKMVDDAIKDFKKSTDYIRTSDRSHGAVGKTVETDRIKEVQDYIRKERNKEYDVNKGEYVDSEK